MFYVKAALATLAAVLLWGSVLAAGAMFGWWRQPLAAADDADGFLAAARALVEEHNRGQVALVLLDNGAISGEHYASIGAGVDRDTVFPLASLSKWITAWGVMTLVESGSLDLDRSVADYLRRWQLPESGFDNSGVTARRLLSHTAGLTDGLGFADHRSDEAVPTLLESLREPRASSGKPARIAVGLEPGSEWRYSGGGYLILELLVEDLSGEPFDAYLRRALFAPLGMSTASYAFLGDLPGAAVSYTASGRPGPYYRYACRAATGLSASASDLIRFVRAQLPQSESVASRPLRQATIDAMRVPQISVLGQGIWGLGTILYAPTPGGDHVFGHDGGNEPAINTTVRINPDTGDAIIALVTGNSRLASTLGFHWVFWQTGLPDVFSLGSEISRVLPVMVVGWGLILLASVVLAFRRRRARERA
ncbi:MAG: serine hydrolase domain-containing protein [Pseudomonadales bacterium]